MARGEPADEAGGAVVSDPVDRGHDDSVLIGPAWVGHGAPFGSCWPCHALLELPEGVPEDEVVHSALRRAVRVYGLSRYRVDAPRAGEADVPPALVLGFGNVNEERIRRGVEVLGEVLSGAHA